MQDGKKLLLASTRVQFLADIPDQPDGFGGAGRMGKSDSRLGENMIFEERTMLKISTTKGGGGVGLDFEPWGPSYYRKIDRNRETAYNHAQDNTPSGSANFGSR